MPSRRLLLAFYPSIPASDGTSMTPPENAEFKVYELSDTTFSTPLPLQSVAGLDAAPLVTTAQGVVPPVNVVSPNFSHIFKSGEWEWRRDSFDAAEKATRQSAEDAERSRIAAEEAARMAAAPADEAVVDALTREGSSTRDLLTSEVRAAANGKLDKSETETAVRDAMSRDGSAARAVLVGEIQAATVGKLEKADAATTYATKASVTTELNTRVEPLVAAYIGSQPAVVQAAAAAVDANPKINELSTTTVRLRGKLADGTNLNTVTTPGEYDVTSAASLNSLLNGPVQQGDLDSVQPGTLTVRTAGAGLTVQELRGYNAGGCWARSNTNLSYTAWTRWRQVSSGYVSGKLPADANADTYAAGAYRGAWVVADQASADTIRNLPVKVPGLLDVLSLASTMPMQEYRSFESVPRRWTRTRDVAGGKPWGAWVLEGGSSGGSATDANRLLVEAFTRRRGGRRGTGGTGAIAFRFDHNVEPFKNKVLPRLIARGIPATLAVVADMLDPGYSRDPATTVTWQEIQGWAHNHGIEPAWHSKTHEVADNIQAITSEIVGGYEKIATNLPQCAIETALMVGVSGTYYGGFGPVDSPAKFYDTEAGRLFLRTVAVTNGHMGGYFRPLTGQPQQGLAHETIEAYASAADIIALIREAQDTGSGLCVMMHPSNLDAPGYITSAILDEVLNYVAAERNAGRLAVLTHSGLLMADASTSYVHSLTTDGRFSRGLESWVGAGWTSAVDAGTTWAASPVTNGELYQDLRFTRRYALSGGARELVVKARSRDGGTLRLNVSDRSAYSTMNAAREFIVPAGSAPAEYRMPLIVPYSPTGYPSMTIRTAISRIAGGSIEITDVRLQTV